MNMETYGSSCSSGDSSFSATCSRLPSKRRRSASKMSPMPPRERRPSTRYVSIVSTTRLNLLEPCARIPRHEERYVSQRVVLTAGRGNLSTLDSRLSTLREGLGRREGEDEILVARLTVTESRTDHRVL